jgi:glycosyltransferase involved in cell wall biosynthesis
MSRSIEASDNGRKVLIIVENLPVPHDKRPWQEAKSLTAAGYKVAVISPKGHGSNDSHEVIDGVSIYRHSFPIEARDGAAYILEYGWAFVCELLLAWKVKFHHGFDIIHACNPPDNIYLIARMFRALFGTKFIFDHHDGNLELWLARGGGRGLIFSALSYLERNSFRAADASLAVNDHYAGLARERGGMEHDAVFTVRNAPARDVVERTVKEADQLSHRNEGRCVIGYIGVMGRQDSIDNFLRIIDILVNDRRRDDLEFRIMGDGPEFASLKELAVELSIEKWVTFTGWVSGDAYVENLAACDICVNADEVNNYNMNCSPNKIYEYMLFAKPIVQFSMTESRLVADEAALYAFDNNNEEFADRIIELADDPERRIAMGALGKERFLEFFTWDNSERELLKAYEYVFDLD